MLDSDMPALGALLAPRSIDEFFDQFWPDKSTYFLAAGDPARLPEFLRTEELHNIEAIARANKGGVWVSNAAKSGHMMRVDKRAAVGLPRGLLASRLSRAGAGSTANPGAGAAWLSLMGSGQ